MTDIEQERTRFENLVHFESEEESKKRIKKAAGGECTPLAIDKEQLTGEFKGSSGYYETTLVSCTCVDYRRRKKPCKHMYRLAAELGVFDIGSTVTDKNKQELTKEEKANLYDKMFAAIDSYDCNTQEHLSFLIYYCKKDSKTTDTAERLAPYIRDGIFSEVNDPAYIISSHTQKNTVEGLLAINYPFPEDLKQTKKARYLYSLDHAEEICKLIYPDWLTVEFTPNFKKVMTKTYSYLLERLREQGIGLDTVEF